MKKTVVTILLVLPFILMFVISFMAKIMSNYQYIYTDSVCFVDHNNKCNSDFIKLNINETYGLRVKVYPELATNKKVTYASLDSEIVEVNAEGIIKALNYGVTKVSVKTDDGNHKAELLVKVSSDSVSSIILNKEEIELKARGELFELGEFIEINPSTAIDKRVTWESYDTTIATVDANGRVRGIKEGETTIKVTTIDGNYFATCKVIVKEFDEPFDKVRYEDGKSIYMINSEYYDLYNLVVIYDDTLVNKNTLHYSIVFNESNDSSKVYIDENNYLHIIENNIVVILIEADGIEYKTLIYVQYKR